VCSERECAGFDPCAGTVPAGQWLHRNDSAFAPAAAGAPATAINRYHIANATAPPGVRVWTCEPDFAELRVSGNFTCNNLTVCEDCASTVRTQMLRWAFAEGWGCFGTADVTEGHRLSQTDTPNQLEACALPPHGSWAPCPAGASDCCAFTCANGWTATVDACEDPCLGAGAACALGEKMTSVCPHDPGLYICEPCPPKAGSVFAAWAPSAPSTCQYTECDSGTVPDAGVCAPCPSNTFSPGNASACTPCPRGTEAPPGSSACSPCFEGSPPANQTCAPGAEASRNLSTALARLAGAALPPELQESTMRAFCAAGFACLPCLPGSYESGGACLPCAVGTYQHTPAATACLACGNHTTTAAPGSTSGDDCGCADGFIEVPLTESQPQ